MALVLDTPPLPLAVDSNGVVRVGHTRVTLDTVVSAFKNGATPEQIAHDYSVLDLADIYAVINFYLRRREQVETYLTERRQAGEKLRQQLESAYDPHGIRERLLVRRKSKDESDAPTSGR